MTKTMPDVIYATVSGGQRHWEHFNWQNQCTRYTRTPDNRVGEDEAAFRRVMAKINVSPVVANICFDALRALTQDKGGADA